MSILLQGNGISEDGLIDIEQKTKALLHGRNPQSNAV